jgi:hypothetical protein
MATKYKLVLDKPSEQAIYFPSLIPELPDSEDWEVELQFKLADVSNNNGIFGTFTDNASTYVPYMIAKTNGTISEISSGGSETSQGVGYDFTPIVTLKMSHVGGDSNNVTYDVNGIVSTEASPYGSFPDFNYLFGFVRNKEGQASYYYGADFYYLKITSPSFTETWDANFISSSGNVTTLPSSSGNRDATLPNGGTSVAYDDGTGGGTNTKPVAVIGANASINTGALFTADLSASYDDDDDTITYSTTLDIPAGSSATLSGEATATPSFTPDVDGTYTITSTVNDGTEASDEVTQVLTATTASGSVSNAGSDSVQYAGTNVSLNGSASVGSSFTWSILQAPTSSTATISNASSQNASINLSAIGLYEFQLDVDGELSRVFVRVRAVIQPRTPIASITLSGTEELGRTVTLIAEGKYNA